MTKNAPYSFLPKLRLLVIAGAALMLVSCISVDDFGDTWKSAFLDPAVAGRWVNAADPSEVIAVGKLGNSYKADYSKDGVPDKPLYPVRNLAVGKYKFFMTRDQGRKGGDIERYDVTNGAIRTYLAEDAIYDFIKESYPSQAKISMNGNMVKILTIKVLDNEVLQMLASVPDTDKYWRIDKTLEKIAP